jgi:hypothetical protein
MASIHPVHGRNQRQTHCDPALDVATAGSCAAAGLQLFSDAIHIPFDVMRSQHAEAVHAGLMANSILESRDFEKTIDALEHLALGPFARQV